MDFLYGEWEVSGDDDPNLLPLCFVVTKESQAADETLARISEDLIGRIKSLDTDNAEELQRLIERVKNTQRNEFVLIVGTKGAGKSTFIDRFFLHVLPKELRDDCIVAKINLADSEGNEKDVPNWLNQHLLKTLEDLIFENGAPTYEQLQGIFYDEYNRWRRGSYHYLYDRDREQFKIEFGKHIEQRREERQHEYIERLLSHIVRVRRKLPCIVFDNADHFTIEFQERVFQYARSIYEKQLCLIIMPITDKTSWHLSREGALRSFESASLFLPIPSPRKILERRIEFLGLKLADERRESGRGYFVGRGIHLSLEDLTAFTAALQSVFLRTGSVARWIGHLANR